MSNLLSRKTKEQVASDLRVMIYQADVPSTSHTHTPGTLTVSTTNSATSPHTHAITTSSNPGAAAAILASDSNGELTLQGITIDNLDIDGNTISSTSGNIILDPNSTSSVIVQNVANAGTASTDADELVIELGTTNENGGMSILTVSNATANIFFGSNTDTKGAFISWANSGETNGNTLTIGTSVSTQGEIVFQTGNEAEAVRIDEYGALMINDTSNERNEPMLIVNQGANDNEIAQFRSSDVAHGMTDVVVTDTYGFLKKVAANQGGLEIHALRDAGSFETMILRASSAAAANTTKSTSARGLILFDTRVKSGTGVTNVGTDGNMVVLSNNGSARAIFDAEGELHLDGPASGDAFDEYDDVALMRGFRASITPGMSERFSHFVAYAKPILSQGGVVTYNDDGHHFIALKAFLMFLVDTILQMHGSFDRRISALESRMETR